MFKINKKRIILSFFITLIIFILIALYSSDRFMITLPRVLDSLSNNSLSLTDKSNKILKTFEKINPFKSKYVLYNYKLPILEILIDEKKLKIIDKNIESNIKNSKYNDVYKFDYLNESVKAQLKVKNKLYKINLKLHGTASSHFVNSKKSYKIKITNKNKSYYKNMKYFNLIIPKELSQVAIIANTFIPSTLSLPPANIFPIILKINDKNEGLYYLEEHLSKEFLEKTNRAGVDVITGNDDMGHQYSSNHSTSFHGLLSNTDFKNFSGLNLDQMNKYRELMTVENYQDFIELINVDDFAKFQAINSIIFDHGHSSALDNLRLLYNTSNGKFSPYIRIESKIENMYSSNAQTIDEGLVFSNNVFGLQADEKHFLYKLTLNNDFRKLRNQYIYELISNKNEIINYSKKIVDEHNKYISADTTNYLPNRVLIKERLDILKKIKNNFDFAEKYLNYSRVFLNLEKNFLNNYDLKIIADSNDNIKFKKFNIRFKKTNDVFRKKYLTINYKNSPIKIESEWDAEGEFFDISNYLNKFEYAANLNKKLMPIQNPIDFKIEFNEKLLIKNIQVESLTEISKKNTSEYDIYPFINNFSSNEPQSLSLIKLNEKYKNLKINKIDSKTVIFTKGDYLIDENIIFPKNINVILEAGSNIKIMPNKSILIKGNLQINGKKNNEVKISNALEDIPFGVFAAVGNMNTICSINYLELSGGSETILENKYLSGALSIYSQKETIIKNSKFTNNVADDAINVKNSNVKLINNYFDSNFSDNVDLDYVKGLIISNVFKNTNNNLNNSSNGDGLDISGSKVYVFDSLFDKFKDKGISVGENSKVIIHQSTLKNNNSGIAIKDSSKVYLGTNKLENNKIDINMFVKKKIFNHPNLYIIFSNQNSKTDIEHNNQAVIFISTDGFNSDKNKFNIDKTNIDIKYMDELFFILEKNNWINTDNINKKN